MTISHSTQLSNAIHSLNAFISTIQSLKDHLESSVSPNDPSLKLLSTASVHGDRLAKDSIKIIFRGFTVSEIKSLVEAHLKH